MSWQDRLQNIDFKITTGDGKSFEPLWINGESSIEFNAKKYEFINVPGSRIDRKRPKGENFPLQFYFQGSDNIEQVANFIKSAKDPRPWKVQHPFYGNITGQPLKISRYDDNYNVTRIVVDFWETLTSDFPKSKVSSRDLIQSKVTDLKTAGVTSYVSGAAPSSRDILTIKENTKDVSAKFNRIQTTETSIEYKNTFATSIKLVDNLIAEPGKLIESNQKLVSLPATYDQPVATRINTLGIAFDELKSMLGSRNDKYYVESQGSTIIGSMSTAAMTPQADDYTTRSQVNAVAQKISAVYSDYLETVDNAQVDRYDVANAWSQNSTLQQILSEVVQDTLANLYQLAFESKQEMVVEVPAQTNLIVAAHKYMGLDATDENLERFRTINNIRNDELFRIHKGRQLKYFV